MKIKIPTPESLRRRIDSRRVSDPPVADEGLWREWVDMSGKSSNVAAVRYNDQAALLEIAFQSGGTYRYSAVPETVYLNFLQAPSPGRFVHFSIKGRFPAYPLR